MPWRLDDTRKEWNEFAEWLAEDPKVDEIESGGGEFVVARLFRTSVGDFAVNGGLGGAWITRFDEAGWARKQATVGRHGVEALTAGLTAVGLPEAEALRIAEEMEPLIESRRFRAKPPRPWYRPPGIKFAGLYAAPWGIGVALVTTRFIGIVRRHASS